MIMIRALISAPFKLYDKAIKGDVLSKNTLVKKRVLKSLEKALTEKGYTLSETEEADFVVVAQAGVKERMQVTNWGGYGWYGPGWGTYGHTDVSYYEQGSLVINIVDAKRKELVWRGVATGTLKDYSDAAQMQADLDKTIGKVLDNFPPPEKK